MSDVAASVVVSVWTIPRVSVPTCTFIPKYHCCPYFVCLISGSRVAVACLIIATAACTSGNDASGPRNSVALTGDAVGCDTVCVVTDDPSAFSAMAIPADSLDSRVLLARLVWNQLPRGSVRARLAGTATLSPTEA